MLEGGDNGVFCLFSFEENDCLVTDGYGGGSNTIWRPSGHGAPGLEPAEGTPQHC
jgi:hypothetical protein